MLKDERVQWKHSELIVSQGKGKNSIIWDSWLIVLNVHTAGEIRKAQFCCQYSVLSWLFQEQTHWRGWVILNGFCRSNKSWATKRECI